MYGLSRQDNKPIWEQDHRKLQVECWGRDSLRVRVTLQSEIREDLPGALLPPESLQPQMDLAPTRATIQNGKLAAEIDIEKSTIRFFDPTTGTEYLVQQAPRFRWPPALNLAPVQGDLFRAEVWFKAYEGERFYGLGQHQHGHLNQKGCVIDLLQCNTEVTVPFLVSSRNYGFLWNNPAIGRVELGTNATRWVAEATSQVDYWITSGATPAEIMAHYADATGHAPVFPEWAAGFWQSKLRYATQDELLSVAREYKRRGLPLSVIVIDFFHWTVQGDWTFDPIKWPDPAGMIRELAELGVRVMVSVWPTVNTHSRNYAEMRRRGLLLRSERGSPIEKPFRDNKPEGLVPAQFYDATNPEARQYIWERVREGYFQSGIRLWWLDACEPDYFPFHPDNVRYHLGNGLAVGNIYPMLHVRGIYEGMRGEGEEEIVNLCRSAWAGSQRYGTILWSGDIDSTFEVLQAQVRAGLNAAMSGIPWWTTDIGGFFNGDPESPYFRELIVRWFQYGVFCPVFRLHGFREPALRNTVSSGGPNEVWSFGEKAYEIICELLHLRERLKPYLMEQMRLAHEQGIPPMRPLLFDFPDDQGSVDVEDAFMFGPDLLVAPVLYQGDRTRRVYLPSGARWTDARTGQQHDGGQSITVPAPLEHIPVFWRGAARFSLKP
jgi:alpha-D-xyloside xylohydrolase